MDTTPDNLRTVRSLWPLLDAAPSRARRDPVRETTAAARARARARWEDEQTDKLAGAIGRGASPAPCDLAIVDTRIAVEARLFALADEVAGRIQRPAPRTRRTRITRVSLSKRVTQVVTHRAPPPDLTRWRYNLDRHPSRGVPWACTWLLGAWDAVLPIDLHTAVADAAAVSARQVRLAHEGQTVHDAGACPACQVPMTVAPWDDVITCPGCHTAYGLRRWLLMSGRELPLADAKVAARFARVSPSTVRSWVRRGKLTIKGTDGRKALYDLRDVDEIAPRRDEP